MAITTATGARAVKDNITAYDTLRWAGFSIRDTDSGSTRCTLHYVAPIGYNRV